MSADWDRTAIETLRRLWSAGVTAQKIADALNAQAGEVGAFTRSSAIGKAHRLLLDRRPSPIRKDRDPNSQRSQRTFLFGTPAKAKPAPIAKPDSLPQVPPKPRPRVDSEYQPVSLSVPFAELNPLGCKWATTPHHVRPEQHRFCNAPRADFGPWCRAHAARATGKPTHSEARTNFSDVKTCLKAERKECAA